MGTTSKTSGGWFWVWIALAFLLGAVAGFVGCLVLLAVIQARIAYAQ